MSLCLVSAFLDINRSEWPLFTRSIDKYINDFKPYLKLNHSMVVFIDSKHRDKVAELIRYNNNITLIPIDNEWMRSHITAYIYLETENTIMQTDKFKELIRHRIHHPECSKPEYNIIQHSKIDFVNHVIEHVDPQHTYYAWTDFGYFQDLNNIPTGNLDLSKFDLDKINLQGINPLNQYDYNILYTLQHAREKIGGFFYLGNKINMKYYQVLYHKILNMFYVNGIVDDDQHIMIQCVNANKDLFKIWDMNGWHKTYTFFSDNTFIK